MITESKQVRYSQVATGYGSEKTINDFLISCQNNNGLNIDAFGVLLFRIQYELSCRCKFEHTLKTLPVQELYNALPEEICRKKGVFTNTVFVGLVVHLFYLLTTCNIRTNRILVRADNSIPQELELLTRANGLISKGLFNWIKLVPDSKLDQFIRQAGFNTTLFFTEPVVVDTAQKTDPEIAKKLSLLLSAITQRAVRKESIQELVHLVKHSDEALSPLIARANELMPEGFIMSTLNWQGLIRNIARNKNVMITGGAGSGKTTVVRLAAQVLNRPFYSFNMGATQDPKTFLLGSMQFSNQQGTYHQPSEFIQAVQIPHAIILLDEITRAHPEANNILLSAMENDKKVRLIRLDDLGNKQIKVHPTVCFVATANVGIEYTGTHFLDRAVEDRFEMNITMEVMTQQQEEIFLRNQFPRIPMKVIAAISEIANITRREIESESPKLSKAISTRTVIQWADHINDGFAFEQATKLVVENLYSTEGGAESERTFFRQIIQKYVSGDLYSNKLF